MKTRSKLTMAVITRRVLRLRPGQSFRVETNSQRVMALQAAKMAMCMGRSEYRQIVSRKRKQGGYTIAAL